MGADEATGGRLALARIEAIADALGPPLEHAPTATAATTASAAAAAAGRETIRTVVMTSVLQWDPGPEQRRA